MNGMSVKNFCNETLSKTNFPLGRIKVHLILSIFFSVDIFVVLDLLNFLVLYYCVAISCLLFTRIFLSLIQLK